MGYHLKNCYVIPQVFQISLVPYQGDNDVRFRIFTKSLKNPLNFFERLKPGVATYRHWHNVFRDLHLYFLIILMIDTLEQTGDTRRIVLVMKCSLIIAF